MHSHVCFVNSDGSLDGQLIWEALNFVAALRQWKSHWLTERVRLEVRADNVTALTLLAALKGRGFGLNLLALELALDLGDGSFRPDVLCHTPGAASKVADTIRRRYDPAAKDTFEVPTLLRQAAEVVPPIRDLAFFISYLGAAEHARVLGGAEGVSRVRPGRQGRQWLCPLDVASGTPHPGWQ